MLSPSSTIAIEAQQAVSLPSTPMHSNVDELVHKQHHKALEVEIELLDQDRFLQANEAQGANDRILKQECFWTLSSRDMPQISAQTEQQGQNRASTP